MGAAGKSNKETLRLACTDGINWPVAEYMRLWLQLDVGWLQQLAE